MYRVWYSTESFADFIIDHTMLKYEEVIKNKMYESDANNPVNFHATPDHIRKILYLDAPDLIVEKDNEPVFSIEVTTEAGTGHNAFQRFARIAAAVENNVPAFYIYPEGAIITRKVRKHIDSTITSGPATGTVISSEKTAVFSKWDEINPLIFRALESVMSVYDIPALLYYFPSDIKQYKDNADASPNFQKKGLRFDKDIVNYSGCPDSSDEGMQNMFSVLDEILIATASGVVASRGNLLKNIKIREQRNFMQMEFAKKSNGTAEMDMSPLSAVKFVPTEYVLNYLSKYEDSDYQIGELLRSRKTTAIYQCNAKFRGDPYPGALAAIDYLACREGLTFEDRKNNLILLFGALTVDDENKTLIIDDEKNSTIDDFFSDVKSSARHNLLVKDYAELRNKEIPRYLMQVRYGSTYSKVKHIRVYSYFADAILFPDGSMWRDG